MEFILESVRADWEAFLRLGPRLVHAAVLFTVVSRRAVEGRLVGTPRLHTVLVIFFSSICSLEARSM